MAHAFALALAAALIDVTIGSPVALGAPARVLASWLHIVRAAGEGWSGWATLLLYLAPVAVAAAAVAQILPAGPFGFAATALLCSFLSGRQTLDRRGRAVATAWETEGPYEALAAAEALGGDEAEPRLARASAAAIAARFADEVAAPTLFILIGGLPGVALCRALTSAGRFCRDRRDATPFARAVAGLEGWTTTPAARVGALLLVLAAGRLSALAGAAGPAPRPTAPAEAAMLAALGEARRDDPGYIRRALALFRRAAALEMAVLAALALTTAALG